MPAERTIEQHDKREVEESTWLLAANGDISFAPNVTPGTFTDFYTLNPHDHTTSSPLLQGGAVATRRSGHGRKKPINHIPRPPNAFILFRSAFVKNQHVSSEVETNHSTLSKIIGLTWKSLPKEERQIWYARAKIEQDEHKRKYPSYAFKPVHNKPRALPGEKRKVREVGPKDHTRCEKIAELLVRGKKGLELEAAIQEFDKNHVPEIITRFEAPITANSYTSINNTDKCSSTSSNSACSPVSNSTESLPSTPCQFNDASFTLANNRWPDYTSDEPYPDHSHSFYPMYPSVHYASFGGDHEYGDIHRIYTLPNCELEYKTPVQTQETMDLSTFMGSLLSYSL